jgi:tungstate transport system substrate-binding protein
MSEQRSETGDAKPNTTRRRMLQAVGAGAALSIAGCTGQQGATPTAGDGGDGGEGSDASSGGSGGTEEPQRSQNDQDGGQVGDGQLVLATTTSTYDTGLLDALNPMFQESFGIQVRTISQGTGAAIRTGRNGDADVILVHARGPEDQFLRDGAGVNRRDVMFNDFVIVGPEDDPAGINGMSSATEAFATIAEEEATFLSRGDDSGTNTKELNIWEEAGIQPSGSWYQETGQGMGDTLVQANQAGGYTLADRGTYLATQDNIDLVIHVQGPIRDGPAILQNPYGVIPVNPAVHDNVNYQAAMAYVGFLTSPAGQQAIADYTANGSQLFFPNALAEEPDFAQYVPEDYEGPSMSMQDLRFQHWVDQQVPEGF